MEAYPFVPNNKNNALSCEDVMKVSRILRTSLANPQHAIEDARSFAETVSPADKTLNEFIAKIVCRDDDSCVEETRLSLINTTTEIYTARITHSDSNWQHGEEVWKKKNICRHGQLCTQLLDLAILCMAAAGNFAARETNLNSTDKSVPADSSLDEEPEKAGNSLRAFSWKMWKKGIKSVGLLRDRASSAVPEDDVRGKKDGIDITVENNNKEAEDKDDLKGAQTRKHNVINRADKNSHFTETSNSLVEKISPSTVGRSSENTIIQEAAQGSHMSKDNMRAGGTSQKRARKKLPNVAKSFLKSDLIDGGAEEEREHITATLKKLQLEKEMLKEEKNALRSETDRLIKENRETKASLRRVKAEKENLTREYKQLQAQSEEHERRSRQHTFVLNTRLERLQHAKLAADQGCLKLSLKQERLVVYEQHVILMCLRVMKTIKLELEQTQDLFNVANIAADCCCSLANSTWNEDPPNGEGLTMFEAHHRLEKQILELIKRYRTVIQLLTAVKGKDEKQSECGNAELNRQFFTIEEGNRDSLPQYDEHFELHSAPTTESDSSCCVSIYDGVSARDIQHNGSLNKRAANERRENALAPAKNTAKRSGKGVCSHGEPFTRQRKVDDIKSDTEKANFFKKMPSSNECPTSDASGHRRNSLDTLNQGQRSCSSIAALVTTSQTSSIETGLTKQRNTECSACMKNTEDARRVKKSMSTCGRRGRPFNVHLN